MTHSTDHAALITGPNPELSDLALSWTTAEYTAEDGIGPMGSLHEAGDSLVAVARFGDDGTTVVGSGVMVGPGLLLTATHVLDEFLSDGSGPVFLTFLPNGTRAWLPFDLMTVSRLSQFDGRRKVVSDISLVSCTLNSTAHPDRPMMLAPMEVALPLVGSRLWAMGFRHQRIQDGAALLTPLITSGLVAAAFPKGRGERMASPRFEVEMDTPGGMSGGPVVNADGHLVGIVSSSLAGGPTHVTLIWEALRFRVKSSIPKLSKNESVSLLGASALGFAKLKGRVQRDPFGEITLELSPDEMKLLTESVTASEICARKPSALDADQLEVFLGTWGSDMEAAALQGALQALTQLSLPAMRDILEPSGVPVEHLDAIRGFSVKDFDGLDDISVVLIEEIDDRCFRLEFHIFVRAVIWTVEMVEDFTRQNATQLDVYFFDRWTESGVTNLTIAQHLYFKGSMIFNRASELFESATITHSAIKPRGADPKISAPPAAALPKADIAE